MILRDLVDFRHMKFAKKIEHLREVLIILTIANDDFI
jgi:hypothetical protein